MKIKLSWKVQEIKSFLEKKNIKICIVGLGYVGLPLAVEFSKIFKVVGYDVNQSRTHQLKKGYDKNLEVSENEIRLVKKNLQFSNNIEDIKTSNVYIVTVPTPILKNKTPNLKPLIV